MTLSENAIKLLKTRYCRNNEAPEGVFKRVAKVLGKAQNGNEVDFLRVMEDLDFLPNSPVLWNFGEGPEFNMCGKACHVLDIEDDLKNILETYRDTGLIFQTGGGVGYNFSKLRHAGAPLSKKGESSGVLSFIKLFDVLINTVKAGGTRRGAAMSILEYDHPDILHFVQSKLKGDLTNFNISVLVDDNFMKKIKTDEYITLKERHGKKENAGKIKAGGLFDAICACAWSSGDPGMIFKDRVNRDNPYPEKLKACNPCFSGDTKVDTLYGKIPMQDLVGKEILVYCYDGKKINISKMYNIRKTGKKKDIYKVTLDNGETIKTTYNHKFMLRDGSYKELKDLSIGESLMPFKRYKRNSKGYNQIALNNGTSLGEAQFVAEWKYGRKIKKNECVHHIDGNKQNNSPENLQIEKFSKHSSNHMIGDKNPLRRFPNRNPMYMYPGIMAGANNPRWENSISIEDVVKLKNKGLNKTQIARELDTTFNIVNKRLELVKNHKITKIEPCGKEDVYDGEVELYHNFALGAGIIVHNCGEQYLFPGESCCLGSINLAHMVTKEGTIDIKKFRETIRIGTNFLLSVNQLNKFPLDYLYVQQAKYNRIGLGVMGFADMLMKMGVLYDSKEALLVIRKLGKELLKTKKWAPNSASTRSIAPTGSLSIIANTSPSIEPIFSAEYNRNLSSDLGTIKESRDSKFLRTAHEVSPEWHLKIQAEWQNFIDNGVSKTVNLSHEATMEDIRKIYYNAWKWGCKGVTIFRNGSKGSVMEVIKPTQPKQKCEGDSCTL